MPPIKLGLRIKAVLSKWNLKNLVKSFLAALGVIWLSIELSSWAFPEALGEIDRPKTMGLSLLFALAYACITSFPPVRFSKKFKSKSLDIEVIVGDILNLNDMHNVAILSSDYFDSCVNTAISKKSLKAKLIQEYFAGVSDNFDSAIDSSLKSQGIAGSTNSSKRRGRNRLQQYTIGTVAVVPLGIRKAFIVVAAKFDDLSSRTETTADGLWTSLLSLWNYSMTHGHRGEIAVPIWGSNLGNAPGNRLVLFQTILCSFAAAVASSHQPPATKLKIFIWEGDYDPCEFQDMRNILDQFET